MACPLLVVFTTRSRVRHECVFFWRSRKMAVGRGGISEMEMRELTWQDLMSINGVGR